jgi:uncharacterized protein (TIGR02466 family)
LALLAEGCCIPRLLKRGDLAPQPGTALIWESWLRHEAPPNAANSERIPVSFNYA